VRLPLKGSGFNNPYLVPGAYDKPYGPWDNTVSPRAERSPLRVLDLIPLLRCGLARLKPSGPRDITVNPLVVGMVEKPSGFRVPCKLSMGYP